jgi:hypothetical protein
MRQPPENSAHGRRWIARRFTLDHERGALPIGREHDLDQALGTAWNLLRHPSEPCGLGKRDRAFIGRDFARNGVEQGGLARAVAADEAHTRSLGERDRGLLVKRAPGDAQGEPVDVEHEGLVARERGEGKAGRLHGLRS